MVGLSVDGRQTVIAKGQHFVGDWCCSSQVLLASLRYLILSNYIIYYKYTIIHIHLEQSPALRYTLSI